MILENLRINSYIYVCVCAQFSKKIKNLKNRLNNFYKTANSFMFSLFGENHWFFESVRGKPKT